MKIAVVTGASSGIGWEFVKQLDQSEQLDQIWVIARRRERLEELAREVRTPLRPIALDLTEAESFYIYKQMLEKEKPERCSGFFASIIDEPKQIARQSPRGERLG